MFRTLSKPFKHPTRPYTHPARDSSVEVVMRNINLIVQKQPNMLQTDVRLGRSRSRGAIACCYLEINYQQTQIINRCVCSDGVLLSCCQLAFGGWFRNWYQVVERRWLSSSPRLSPERGVTLFASTMTRST